MPQQIFRQAALDRLSAPEQTDAPPDFPPARWAVVAAGVVCGLSALATWLLAAH